MRQKGRTTQSTPQDRSRTPRIDRYARIAHPAAARTDHPQTLCSVRDIAPHSLNQTSPSMKTPQKPTMRIAGAGRRTMHAWRAAGSRSVAPYASSSSASPNRVPGPAQWHSSAGWRRVMRRGGATVPRPRPGLGRARAGVPGRWAGPGPDAGLWRARRRCGRGGGGFRRRRRSRDQLDAGLGHPARGPDLLRGLPVGLARVRPRIRAPPRKLPRTGWRKGNCGWERRRHARRRSYSRFPFNSNQTSPLAWGHKLPVISSFYEFSFN